MEQLQGQSTSLCGDLERLAAAAATVGYSPDSLNYQSSMELENVSQMSENSSLTTNANYVDDNFNIGRPIAAPARLDQYSQKIFYNQTNSSISDHVLEESSMELSEKAKTFCLSDKINVISSCSALKEVVYPTYIQAKTINLSSDVQYLDSRNANILMHSLNTKSNCIDQHSSDVDQPLQIVQFAQENICKEPFMAETAKKLEANEENKIVSNKIAGTSTFPVELKVIDEIPKPLLIEGIKYYVCPVCSDKFKKEYLIKRHVISHSGEKRGSLSLEMKVEMIKRIKAGEKQVDLANEYNVGRSTLSSISKNSQKILSVFKDGKFHPESKRMKGAMREDVETVLNEWYQQAVQMGMVISGPILCKKAKDFASKLGHEDFKATHGWLDRFKHRKNIILGKGKIKEKDSKEDRYDSKGNFTEHILPSLLIDYQANDIFYASEMGLFYDILPDEAETLKGKRCSGGVRSKHRITVLLCTNMTGGEKFPLLVIGKNSKPKCFKRVKSLPVQYLTNQKSWMTSEHFSSWLVDLDLWFVQQNRKVLLVVPSLRIHSKFPKLNSVKIIPSPVSFLGPSKFGIIHSLKKNYRRMLLQSYINKLESKNSSTTKRKRRKCNNQFDFLMCLHKLSSAWLAVSQSTITNSFQRSGLGKYGLWSISLPLDSILGTENLDLFHKLNTLGIRIPEGFNFEDYVTFDDDVQVCYLMDDDDIIASVKGSVTSSSDAETSEDEADETQKNNSIGPQFSDVETSLSLIKNHISCHQASEEVYRVISHLEYLLRKTT